MIYVPQNWINNIQPPQNTADESREANILRKLLNRDISINSKKAVLSDLNNFVRWYYKTTGEQFKIQRLTESDILAFRRFCQDQQKHKVATINHRLLTIKAFCEIALEEGFIKSNPAKKVKLLTSQPLAPKSLTPQELRKLLKEVELRGKLRDRLIIELMAGAGLRVSEIVSLTSEDVVITERKGHLTIRNSKGNKTRIVPLNQKNRELLSAYIKEEKSEGQILKGQRGALKNIAINKIVDSYARQARIKCSPHMLRHTFSYNYLNQHPGEIVGLSQILGHSNLNTTAIYTQHRLEDLQERVEAMVY